MVNFFISTRSFGFEWCFQLKPQRLVYLCLTSFLVSSGNDVMIYKKQDINVLISLTIYFYFGDKKWFKMAYEKMSRKSDTKNPPSSIRFQRLSPQSSFQHISWRKIHAYCTRATYRARVEKNHRDNHRQIVSEWRGRRVNDAKISYLASPWRRRQKCLFKKIKRDSLCGLSRVDWSGSVWFFSQGHWWWFNWDWWLFELFL